MVERIAQQMLERTDELFQHRSIELGLRAVDFEIGALVEVACRLAQDPVQPLRQAVERHRADREQSLLNVARQAGLRDQRRVGVVEVLQQRLLDGGNVVDAFGERTRQLLEARVPVELERIEIFLRALHERHPRLDLRLGLQLDLAHLAAQADHAAGELEQVRLEGAQLAFDARARDGDLAGLVDELVDDVRAYPQHRLRGFHVGGVAARRCERRSCDGCRRPSCMRSRLRGTGRCRRRSVRGSGLRKPRQRHAALAVAQRVQHEREPVDIGIERFEKLGAWRYRHVADRQPRFHPVRKLAQAHRAGHPRAAFQRVQRATQLRGARRVIGRAAPSPDLLARLRKELVGLFEEDRQDRLVEIVRDVEQRFVRGNRTRCGRRDDHRRLRPCLLERRRFVNEHLGRRFNRRGFRFRRLVEMVGQRRELDERLG